MNLVSAFRKSFSFMDVANLASSNSNTISPLLENLSITTAGEGPQSTQSQSVKNFHNAGTEERDTSGANDLASGGIQSPEDPSEPADPDADIKIARVIQQGIITNMEPGMSFGFVDGFFKFSQKDFGTTFRLGDKVSFTAVEEDVWQIKEMSHTVTETERQTLENRRYSTFVCKVLEMRDQSNCITVNVPQHENIAIPKQQLPQNYKVNVDDFLEVKTLIDHDSSSSTLGDPSAMTIVSVKPSKTKIIPHGKVTSRGGYSCVDDYILIGAGIWQRSKLPEVGTFVRAEAVETQLRVAGHVFNWRVISISPSKCSEYSDEVEEECDASGSAGTKVKEYINKLLEDKGGIIVNPQNGLDFRVTKIGSVCENSFEILNTSSKTYTLRNVELHNDQSVCKFEIKLPRSEGPNTIAVLLPEGSVVIKIICSPKFVGSTKELCKFNFEEFSVARYISAKCVPMDDSTVKSLVQGSQGRGRGRGLTLAKQESEKRSHSFENRPRVPGIKAVRRAFFLPKIFPPYDCPKCIHEALKENDATLLFETFPSLKVTEVPEFLPLTFARYKDMFQVALWLEEIVYRRQRDMHSLGGVTLFRSSNDEMYFEVPNLKDFQPPLSTGETICARYAEDAEGPSYEASVIKMVGNKVFGKFDSKFQSQYKGDSMIVVFRLGRTTFRRAHYAVEQAPEFLGENWLFPLQVVVKPPRFVFIEADATEEDDDIAEDSLRQVDTRISLIKKKQHIQRTRTRPTVLDIRAKNHFPLPQEADDSEQQTDVSPEVKLKWFKKDLNEEQKDSVRRILRGQCRPLPYIIFGPPGTGKTVTLVEAIMQVHKLDKNSRILVTAPSNAAADLIAEYLAASGEFNPGDFVRLNGYKRELESVSETIKDFCLDGDELENIARNRVIISTCNTSGQFFQLGITPGHFTHVFLDEAGYCHEPEALIPALFVSLARKGQFIMAGDPMQLGPSLVSDAASDYYGLKTSLLERLMALPLYSRDPETKQYNPIMLTKLLRNYRSHDLLIRFPSKIFYDDELVFAASKNDTDGLCHDLDFLPKRGVPLLFHGVRGDEAKDSDSPSWYNALEVVQVVSYVKKLMQNRCSADDIGIITPYRKMVEKINQGIRQELNCQMPKVGSVHEFQGGERKAIIVALVRTYDSESPSEIPLNKFDFLFSPKRFNVSITRAKAVLIVIGNPHLFCQNPIWNSFIKYCVGLEAYVGCDLPIQLNTHLRKSLQNKDRDVSERIAIMHNTLFSSDDDDSSTDSDSSE